MNQNAQAIAFLGQLRRLALDCQSNLAGVQKLTALWSNATIFDVIPNDSVVTQDNNYLQPVTDAMVNTAMSDLNIIAAAYTSAVQARLSLIASGQVQPPI